MIFYRIKTKMTVQLRNLPNRLTSLAFQLREDREINKTINSLISSCNNVTEAYTSAFQNEGNDVLNRKMQLFLIHNPSEVQVENLEKSLSAFKVAIAGAVGKMKGLEHNVHIGIEDCKTMISQQEQKVSLEQANMSRISAEISALETKIDGYEREARKKDVEAAEYNQKADDMERKKREAAEMGLVGAAAGYGVALILAPFSGGASLVAASAAVGWVGGSLIAANELRKKAEKLNEIARDERRRASDVRSKVSDLDRDKSSCYTNMENCRTKIRMLESKSEILDQTHNSLLSAIKLMNTVETNVQDLNCSLHEASDHGKVFEVIQQVFSDSPDDYRDIANESLVDLREKWRMVENEIRRSVRLH